MNSQAAIDRILDHYENPRHYGTLPAPTFVAEGFNPGCGDVVRLAVRLDDEQRITAIAFEGQGCTISQAAASLLVEDILGKRIAEALALDDRALAEMMGPEVVTGRLPCVSLGLRTLRTGWERHRSGTAPSGSR